MAFGHLLLSSHKFMVTAPGSCVKWPYELLLSSSFLLTSLFVCDFQFGFLTNTERLRVCVPVDQNSDHHDLQQSCLFSPTLLPILSSPLVGVMNIHPIKLYSSWRICYTIVSLLRAHRPHQNVKNKRNKRGPIVWGGDLGLILGPHKRFGTSPLLWAMSHT